MSNNPNPRLELTWIGKENRPRLEPRILLEDPSKSYHAKHRSGKKDIFDNRLIFGDNLLALKALEQEFSGKVKCVYIGPPYNTGSAFEHYADRIEHSIWLGLMRDRLELGEHCHTHIVPRLKKVIDGEDSGGVTEAAGWKGGGFRYYRLAPSDSVYWIRGRSTESDFI
jgi:hypothetical protein